MFISKRFPIIFVVILVLVTVALGVLVIKKSEVGHGPLDLKPSPEVQIKTYQSGAQKIISDYLVATSAEASSSKVAASASSAETALLSLAVPSEFQNAHLELVLIFHDGARNIQANSGVAQKNKIESFWKKYPWAK
jgi:hypothetical protein